MFPNILLRRIPLVNCNLNCGLWEEKEKPSQSSMKSLQLSSPPSGPDPRQTLLTKTEESLSLLHMHKQKHSHLLKSMWDLGRDQGAMRMSDSPTFPPTYQRKVGEALEQPWSLGLNTSIASDLLVRDLEHYLAYSLWFIQDLGAFRKPNVDAPWL